MDALRNTYFEESLRPLEDYLLAHPLAELFTGEDITRLEGDVELPFSELQVGTIILSAEVAGRLFMVPDNSVITVAVKPEQENGTPPGLYIESDNPYVQEEATNCVIAYKTPVGNGVHVDQLHVARMLLDPSAPKRFCTLAFGLMAITAFKLDFVEISLFAAGRAPVNKDDPDAMVGFAVWPKFGFDAEVNPAELTVGSLDHSGNDEDDGGTDNAYQQLRHCRTVQDVIAVAPEWWENVGGSGRHMQFDLSPGSRSWSILLDYMYSGILEEDDSDA
jgi:hypothetical protein